MSSQQYQGTIALHVHNADGGFDRAVRAGIYAVLRERGWQMLVVQAPLTIALAHQIAHDHIDGWISVIGDQTARLILEAGVPLVTICHSIAGASMIKPDNAGGIRLLMEHLLSLGHKRILFVGNMLQSDMLERMQSYSEALNDAGIAFDERLVFNCSLSYDPGGVEAAEAMLAAGMPCTAIITGNDMIARGLMERLRADGVRIPEDVAVVGFDDMPHAAIEMPPLTTIRQRYSDLGRLGAERLLAEIADRSLPPTEVVNPARLVVRDSCGALLPRRLKNTAQPAPRAALYFSQGRWMNSLAERLLAALFYPLPPPSAAPAQIWPGVETILRVLSAAIEAMPSPDDRIVQYAWNEAVALAPYAPNLGHVLDLLYDLRTDLPDISEQARVRLELAITRLRDQLFQRNIRASINQVEMYEAAYSDSNSLAAILVGAPPEDIPSLGWLRETGIRAQMALWIGEPGNTLKIVGASAQESMPTATHLSPRSFPMLGPNAMQADVIDLFHVQTPLHDWGYIAVGCLHDEISNDLNTASRWVKLLATRLDDLASHEQLNSRWQELQLAMKREQALSDTVRELGCPIIPLGDGRLLLPLIGLIDSLRAQQIIDTTLSAVSSQATRHVLLDVTGVPMIDTHVAGVLLQLAQMVQLLGARVGIIGVRPEIAQSIVSLGINLSYMHSYASLANALKDG